MCELFAMSSRLPANVTLSLNEFAAHGGATNHHRDGWGIAFFEDRDARLIKEATAASDSPFMQLIRDNDLASEIVVSHIRKATKGSVALKNTHPFSRELGGQRHVFAHNGMLHDVEDAPALGLGVYHPIGGTDSEYAFCALLHRMADLWRGGGTGGTAPALAARLAVVGEFAAIIRALGPANFIYADGETIFAHADRRTQADGEIRAPGLHKLRRTCPTNTTTIATSGLTIAPHAASQETKQETQQETILVASVPLTDEAWTPMAEGEIVVLQGGTAVAKALA